MKKDASYGWLVVAGCCLMHMIVLSVQRANALLFLEVQRSLDVSQRSIGLAMALGSSLTFLLGPVASALCNLFGPRLVVMVGGFLYAAGLFCSRFATDMFLLNIFYGVVSGIGSGLCYSSSIIAVGQYFDKKRALANGISVSGAGIGTLLMAPLIEYLLHEYTHKGTWTIIAGIAIHLCVAGALFRPFVADAEADSPPRRVRGRQMVYGIESSLQSISHLPPPQKMTLLQVFNYTLLKNPVFLLYVIQIGITALSVCFSFLIAVQALYLDFSETEASLLVSLSGGSNIAGRLMFGAISDWKRMDRKLLYKLSLIVSGGAIIGFAYAEAYWVMAVTVALSSFFSGGYTALIAVVLVDVIGADNLPTAFGLASCTMGIGFLISPPISGMLIDGFGHQTYSLFFAGGSMILSGMMLGIERFLKTSLPLPAARSRESNL